MVRYHHIVLGLFILQIYVNAAPSNISNVEEPTIKAEPAEVTKLEEPSTKIEQDKTDEPKLDPQPLPTEESKLDDNSTQSFRQKRFYNFYGYGAPPINPVLYPTYNKRDQSAETGVYGFVEDPLEQIHRRLHDIVSLVRQPVPSPPPPAHFPFLFPVIYIPQYTCDCNSNNGNAPSPQPENPQTPRPQTPKPGTNQTDPDAEERFPELDDERQNWGLLSNETDTEYDENEYARPISFDPIQPNRPPMRPAPPVDHGSSQGNSADTQTTTTVRPTVPPTRRPPPSQARPTAPQGRPFSTPASGPAAVPYPASFAPSSSRNERPSICDGAVLTCCHQAQVSYDCFVVQGCPDPTSYGNPCDPLVILEVIDKYQRFYGARNGK